MSRCCINFTLQLMQMKHISDPSVIKAMNNAIEIRLNKFDRFLYMQHISDHHLSIYLISSNHLLKHNLHLSIHAKLLLSSIYIIIENTCRREEVLYLVCNEERAFFASEEHKNMIYGLVKKWQMHLFIFCTISILGLVYKLYRQNVGIPMGTNCAPFLLICFCEVPHKRKTVRPDTCFQFNF